jgi:thioredoxin-like negative regulator of GroEL
MEALVKTNGKFKLVNIDFKKAWDIRNALNVHVAPSLYLVFKNNIIQHYNGMPSESVQSEFIRSAIYF